MATVQLDEVNEVSRLGRLEAASDDAIEPADQPRAAKVVIVL